MSQQPMPEPVDDNTGKIMTVLGPVSADQMGVTLPHEHVLVDFIGAEEVSRDRYDADVAIDAILPHLEEVRTRRVRTLVECTPAYVGRDPMLVKRIAEATGLNLLVNTGYYGARSGTFLPAHAYRETPQQLAERWVNEWVHGIEDTGIRPGFIKTAVNPDGVLSDMDRKLIRAAALTHRETGLTIAVHTGIGPVFEELEVLRQEGVDPSALIWVHANNELDPRRHVAAAQLGAWVEFDGVTKDVDEDVKRLKRMKEYHLLDRVLLSHDAGWYQPGKPEKVYRGYCDLFDHLIPALKENDFTEEEIDQLTVLNPAGAFAVRVRTNDGQN